MTESIESRLWPVPVAVIVVAVGLGFLLPEVDVRVGDDLPSAVEAVLFNGGASTARTVLSAIAGSLITASSLTFSLTVVALQLASSQASPRVLRLFARDRFVHWTLATFLGTFAYAMTVLRTVRSAEDEAHEFVPRLAVTLSFLLTLASVVMLVLFLAHLAAQLRVETMLKEIHEDTEEVIGRLSSRYEAAEPFQGRIDVPERRHVVVSGKDGFITGCDYAALIEAAAEHGIVVQEVRAVGENVVAGTPLAFWWSDTADAQHDPETIATAVRGAYAFEYERTASDDIDFGVQQILDIGMRALSPGINDPTTAVNALGHLSAIAARTVTMPMLPEGLTDDSEVLRVVTVRRSPADRVESTLAPIRHYLADSPTVVKRFVDAIEEIGYCCPDAEATGALIDQLDALAQQLHCLDSDPVATAHSLALVEGTRERLSSQRAGVRDTATVSHRRSAR